MQLSWWYRKGSVVLGLKTQLFITQEMIKDYFSLNMWVIYTKLRDYNECKKSTVEFVLKLVAHLSYSEK